MAYLLGSNDKVSNCYVCYPAAVKHRHCSTQFYYNRCYNLRREAECFSCLDPDHAPQYKGRLKVLSTSSTLHHVHEARTYESELMKTVEELGAAFHIDVDQISGGRIDDLRKSWKRQYFDQPLPVDTAVVCGLNDIPHLTADEFMNKLDHWRALVAEHSARHQHEKPNTIAFSTPLRAPKYYWHPANRFPPPPGYVNHKAKIDDLIGRIEQFNRDNGVGGMVKLHMEGDRKVAGQWEHMWRQWREFHVAPGEVREYHKFLHLTDERRVRCYMKIFKYFFHQTDFPKIVSPDDSAATPAVYASLAPPSPAMVSPTLSASPASASPPARPATPPAISTATVTTEGRKMRGLYIRLKNIKAQLEPGCGSHYEEAGDESGAAEQGPAVMTVDEALAMTGEEESVGEDVGDPKTCPTKMLDPRNLLDDPDC